jgi:hypothetical protein
MAEQISIAQPIRKLTALTWPNLSNMFRKPQERLGTRNGADSVVTAESPCPKPLSISLLAERAGSNNWQFWSGYLFISITRANLLDAELLTCGNYILDWTLSKPSSDMYHLITLRKKEDINLQMFGKEWNKRLPVRALSFGSVYCVPPGSGSKVQPLNSWIVDSLSGSLEKNLSSSSRAHESQALAAHHYTGW